MELAHSVYHAASHRNGRVHDMLEQTMVSGLMQSIDASFRKC